MKNPVGSCLCTPQETCIPRANLKHIPENMSIHHMLSALVKQLRTLQNKSMIP